MRSKLLLLSVFIMSFSPFLYAQDASNITVEEIHICSSIEDRQPIGIDESFSSDIGRLYCFTKCNCDNDNTSISHVWYYNDKEMAETDLPVRAKTWRTWSSKRIPNSWTGKWRVDVLSPDGKILATTEFNVK